MITTIQNQIVLLLTASFTNGRTDTTSPLTLSEWRRLNTWLSDNEISIETLLTDSPTEILNEWSDQKVSIDRIEYLLGRGNALALAMEKWQRAGLSIITTYNDEYPQRLRDKLGDNAPPVLYICGKVELLNSPSIAIVGSRDASTEDLEYSSHLGMLLSNQGYSVVSGGARGVDEFAMFGALENEGTVIGVLSDGLLRAATSSKYRQGILNKDLVLISPYNPEAGFDVGNAMARNKYIYCLSDAAVVIATNIGKGGTWAGAIENIKNHWVPLWIKHNDYKGLGNSELVSKGAMWLPDEEIDATRLTVWNDEKVDSSTALNPIKNVIGKRDSIKKTGTQELIPF